MIAKSAVVQTDSIGTDVNIGEFAIIRQNTVIGNNVTIHPHAIINSGVLLGDGVEIFPGAFIGKKPGGAGSLARLPKFKSVIRIDANCSIGPHSIIYYDVTLGRDVLVGDGASIREQCSIGDKCIIGRHVTLNYSVTVGRETKIMDHSWMAGNMKIGSNVFISGNVATANDNSMGTVKYSREQMKGPQIEDGARIGAGAVLLPGITVGRQSVIAAGAVVTRNIEPCERVAGIPAVPMADRGMPDVD